MKSTNNAYAKMGMAAMLPGMVHMLELMQAEVDNFRTQLAALQGQEAAADDLPQKPKDARARASGWPDDPEERKAEMARRMKKAKMSKAAKARWGSMTAKERKARLAAMQAGKAPVVRMAAAS
jgi:hypothetical protein